MQVANTYSDVGRVQRVSSGGTTRTVTSVTDFRTDVVKSNSFRFEFETRSFVSSSGVILRYGNGTTRFEPGKGILPETNLDLAIAGLVGLSGGASHTMARLLLSDVSGVSLLFPDVVRMKQESLSNGRPVYEVEATYPRATMTVTIDKQSALILQTFQVRILSRFTSEITTSFRPVVNKPISADVFKIEPLGIPSGSRGM